MKAAHARLLGLCHKTNRVPWWTQGAGSNLSIKDDDTLYIKASGKRLVDMRDENDIAALSLGSLQTELEALLPLQAEPKQADALYRAALEMHLKDKSPAPSMETALHALLPGREVMHLHALVAIALADQLRTNQREARSLVGASGLRLALVPSTLPGWALAQAMAPKREADILLLANHGLVLQGEDAEPVLAAWEALEHEWLLRFDPQGMAARIAAPGAMDDAWLHTPARAAPTLPDVAVFLDKIYGVTHPSDESDAELRHLPASLSDRGAPAVELWAAHVALSHMAPMLPALPSAYVHEVSHLPQEHLRRARMTRDTERRV